jgi:hypothetical protein
MSGSELDAIQDTKFLRDQFDRKLLKLVDASDGYIDYATLRFPIRPLRTRRKYDLNGDPGHHLNVLRPAGASVKLARIPMIPICFSKPMGLRLDGRRQIRQEPRLGVDRAPRRPFALSSTCPV